MHSAMMRLMSATVRLTAPGGLVAEVEEFADVDFDGDEGLRAHPLADARHKHDEVVGRRCGEAP